MNSINQQNQALNTGGQRGRFAFHAYLGYWGLLNSPFLLLQQRTWIISSHEKVATAQPVMCALVGRAVLGHAWLLMGVSAFA